MTDGVELPRVVDGGTLTTVVVVGGGVVVVVVVAAVVGVVVVVVRRFVVTVVECFVAVLSGNSVVVEEDSGMSVLSVDSCSDIPRSTPAGCEPASSAPIAMVFRSNRFVYQCRLTPINPCSFRWFHCKLCGFWRYTWVVWFVGVRVLAVGNKRLRIVDSR